MQTQEATTAQEYDSVPTAVSDTFEVGDYTIVITEISGDFVEVDHPPWNYIYEEEDSLIGISSRVVRIADTLRFIDRKMNKLELVNVEFDSTDDPIGDPAYYYFQDTRLEDDYWEVLGIGYEYHWTTLISRSSLDTINIAGTGALSPQKDLLFYSNIDMEAAYTPHGIGLCTIDDTSHTHVGFVYLDEYGIQEISWTSEGVIYAKKYKMTEDINYLVTDVYVEIIK